MDSTQKARDGELNAPLVQTIKLCSSPTLGAQGPLGVNLGKRENIKVGRLTSIE